MLQIGMVIICIARGGFTGGAGGRGGGGDCQFSYLLPYT